MSVEELMHGRHNLADGSSSSTSQRIADEKEIKEGGGTTMNKRFKGGMKKFTFFFIWVCVFVLLVDTLLMERKTNDPILSV